MILLLGNGFEELEAVACVDILRRAGIELKIAGVCAGDPVGAHGVKIAADMHMKDITAERTEMLILPGGNVDAQGNYGSEPSALALIKGIYEAGVPVGAICAAPAVLDRLGLIGGKRCTCYPELRDSLGGGCCLEEEKVVVDGNLITGQGPGAALDFALAIAEFLMGNEVAGRVRAELRYD